MQEEPRPNRELDVLDYQDQQVYNREVAYNSYKSTVCQNLCCGFCTLLPLIILLSVGANKSWDVEAKEIVIAAIVIKVSLLIPVEILFLCLIKRGSISLAGVKLIKFAFAFLYLGWYIYLTVTFFKGKNNCKKEATTLWVAHLLLVIEAFFYFAFVLLICCLMSCIISLLCCLAGEEMRQKRRNVRVKDIILNATALKLNFQDMQNDDLCVICYENYQPGDKIVRMPCDQRHHFHDNWIEEAIKNKAECPICKAKFDEETVRRINNMERRPN